MHVVVKRVCVPTDFSQPADHAFVYGATLARALGAELRLLHVLENLHEFTTHPGFASHSDAVLRFFMRLEQEAAGRKELDSTEEQASEFLRSLEQGIEQRLDGLPMPDIWEGLNVVRDVRFGHPVDQICRYARKQRIDLLVMGSHGRKGLQQFLLGSVAERVVRAAPCPVLVVREHQRDFVVNDNE